MGFRKVDSRLWDDAKFRRLTSDGRLLWLYLLTNPHAGSLGIYVISKATMADDLQWKLAKLERNLSELLAKGMAQYHEPTRTLLLPNYLKYNSGFSNSASKAAAMRQLKSLPNSPLIQPFIDLAKLYLNVSESLAPVFAFALEDTYAVEDTSPVSNESPKTHSDLNGFGNFKALYPIWKAEESVKAAWKKIAVTEHEKIFEAVAAYRQSADWQKEGGKFIPYPAKFLKEGRWKDKIEAASPLSGAAQTTQANIERLKAKMQPPGGTA